MVISKKKISLFACCFIVCELSVDSEFQENIAPSRSGGYDDQYDSSGDFYSGSYPFDDEEGLLDEINYLSDYFDSMLAGIPNNTTAIPTTTTSTRATTTTKPYHEDGIVCGDGTKIGASEICDGRIDCFDCSDEENCQFASYNVFMCYEAGVTSPSGFTYSNPKCIPISNFCDGKRDCQNGADERQSGPGFRCSVRDRFRQCIVPQRYVSDDMVHCEDRSDMFLPTWGEEISNQFEDSGMVTPQESGYSRTQEASSALFQCFDGELLISLKQLCDGIFDCLDLSDECLCDAQTSTVTKHVCDGLCAQPMWLDQPVNPNCDYCNQGEIYWKSSLFLAEPKGRSIVSDKSPCFTANEIVKKVGLHPRAKETLMHKELDYEIIECFDATINPIRARKCDGRPECMDGEDECGIGCNNDAFDIGSGSESGYFEEINSNSNDPQFCDLLTTDNSGFACKSWMNQNGSRKARFTDTQLETNRIVVCDGKEECPDGTDEMFCPRRIPCTDSNSFSESFDEVQRCDGHPHCLNGKDEDPHECRTYSHGELPCTNRNTSGNPAASFMTQNLLDGKKHCETGDDERPPFFSTIAAVKQAVYGDQIESSQIGISSHDAAVASTALQVFIITISMIGASALAASFALGLYNVTVAWIRLCRSEAFATHTCFAIYVREIVVNIGITLTKGLLCGYFAYLRLKRAEESGYGVIDLHWRSSWTCSILGTVALIGCQIPVLTLCVFTIFCMVYDGVHARFARKTTATNREREYLRDGRRTGRKRSLQHAVMVAICLVLVVIIWVPVVTLVLLLLTPSDIHFQTESYGWIVSRGAPQIFQANLLSQIAAKEFLSKAMALAPNASQNLEFQERGSFTFSYLPNIINNISRDLRVETLGTFGYFSQSGSCLPAFLVHVTGGEAPFDIAVSNPAAISLSALIIAINFALIFCAGVLATRYGAGIFKQCTTKYQTQVRHSILNHTISRLVAIETITWVTITLAFLLKSIDPDIASDRAYATICIVAIGINFGIASPFVLLMRKFRINETSDPKDLHGLTSRTEYASDSQRTAAVEETFEERLHLTDETNQLREEPETFDEIQSLVDVGDREVPRLPSNVKHFPVRNGV